ncbi:MAG: DUF2237 family protein [Haloarculaceae archaeon]
MSGDLNVFGTELRPCGTDPATGYSRDGHCRQFRNDPGRHQVCAVMTDDFLSYSQAQGNDLLTPRPDLGFPGLEPGDRWCICVPRWLEAYEGDCAPPIVPDATNRAVLDDIPIQTVEAYAYDGE